MDRDLAVKPGAARARPRAAAVAIAKSGVIVSIACTPAALAPSRHSERASW
jgi:hypothetical protein